MLRLSFSPSNPGAIKTTSCFANTTSIMEIIPVIKNIKFVKLAVNLSAYSLSRLSMAWLYMGINPLAVAPLMTLVNAIGI